MGIKSPSCYNFSQKFLKMLRACALLTALQAMLRLLFLRFFLCCVPAIFPLLAQDDTAPIMLDAERLADCVRRRDAPDKIAETIARRLPMLVLSAHREAIVDALSQMYAQPRNVQEDFLPFFSSIAVAVAQRISSLQLQHMLETYQEAMRNDPISDTRTLMAAINTFFVERALHTSNFHQWTYEGGTYDFAYSLVDNRQRPPDFFAEDNSPSSGVPVLQLRNITLHFSGKNEHMTLPDITGDYDLVRGLLYGLQCGLPWPVPLPYTWQPLVRLEKYTLNTFRNIIESYQATMYLPEVMPTEETGYFRLQVDVEEGIVPSFFSYGGDIKSHVGYEGVAYIGGISLENDLLQGRSYHDEEGRLTILGNKGHKVVMTGTSFSFPEEKITGERVMATMYHTGGYIDRGSLRLRYSAKDRKILLIRDKDHYPDMPFYASFFDVYFTADLITWLLEEDEVHLSLLSGRGSSSVHFQSGKYFSADEFRRLRGAYAFHPLTTIAHYAENTGKTAFTAAELAARYNLEIRQVVGVLEYLHEHRFVRYNVKNEEVEEISERFWHYLAAKKAQKDYDNLVIQSYTDHPYNATLDTASNTMKVRGVERIHLGAPRDNIYVEPKKGEILMRAQRDFSFDGKVVTRALGYEGANFNFDYDQHTLMLNEVDVLAIGESKLTQSGSVIGGEEVIGEFTETSGKLTIGDWWNASGERRSAKYPAYDSKMPSTLYFDDPNILGGVYDRRFKFVAPEFNVDSINSQDFSNIGFMGTFYGANVLAPIREEIRIMPDRTLGLSHDIPKEGYAMYGNSTSRGFGHLSLDKGGIQLQGNLHHYTTAVYGDSFVVYPEKVKGLAKIVMIEAADYEGGSHYPNATLHDVNMLWLPQQDDMLFTSGDFPMLLYGQVGELYGTLNVKKEGLFAHGTFTMNGGQCVAKFLSFRQGDYTGRRSDFSILTEQEDKPALLAKDVHFTYRVAEAKGYIRSEGRQDTSLSFPYAQMETSIGEAVWDDKNRQVVMKKPADELVEDTHFYFTKEEKEGLSFNGEQAIYDMGTYALQIYGVPHIAVADAHIVPKDHEVVVLEDSYIVPFEDAVLYLDAISRCHTLVQADIEVISHNEFRGEALYEYKTKANTYYINFSQFLFEEVPLTDEEKAMAGALSFDAGMDDDFNKTAVSPRLITLANAYIDEDMAFKPNEGFYFKGQAELRSNRPQLAFRGYLKPAFKNRTANRWIVYEQHSPVEEIAILFDEATFQPLEDTSSLVETTFGHQGTEWSASFTDEPAEETAEGGEALIAGIFYDVSATDMYVSFLEDKRSPSDRAVFIPSGLLTYDKELDAFMIRDESRRLGDLAGRSFVFYEEENTVHFEGPCWMGDETKLFYINAFCVGSAHLDSHAYSAAVLLFYEVDMGLKVIEQLASHVAERAKGGVLLPAYDFGDESFPILLANYGGEEVMRRYEEEGLVENTPLHQFLPGITEGMLLSSLRLVWNPTYGIWHNDGSIGLVNIADRSINALVDGYLEIALPNNEQGGGMKVLFIFSEQDWYYFSHVAGENRFLSGDYSINSLVDDRARRTVLSTQEEVETFLGDIASTYAGNPLVVLAFPKAIKVREGEDEALWTSEEGSVHAEEEAEKVTQEEVSNDEYDEYDEYDDPWGSAPPAEETLPQAPTEEEAENIWGDF